MLDIAKQIDYWLSSSESNIETAEILINSGKYLEGMFFCHLSVEKILKEYRSDSTKISRFIFSH